MTVAAAVAVVSGLAVFGLIAPRVPPSLPPGGGRHRSTRLRRLGWLPVVASVAAGVSFGSPAVTWIGSGVVLLGPRVWRTVDDQRRRRHRADAVPEMADLLAHRVRSGSTLSVALRDDPPDALTDSIHAIRRDTDSGRPLASVLEDHAASETGELRLLLLTCSVLLRTAGPPADGLERLADSLRSSAAAMAEARAQSGQQLASGAVMAILPVAFAAVFAVSDERAAALYLRTGLGAACLGASLGLSLVGWLWMQRILGGADR